MKHAKNNSKKETQTMLVGSEHPHDLQNGSGCGFGILFSMLLVLVKNLMMCLTDSLLYDIFITICLTDWRCRSLVQDLSYKLAT